MTYIDKFIDYLKVVKKDSNYTLDNYRRDLLEFYQVFNNYLNIDKKDVSKYLEYLYSRGLSRNSISRKLSAIRSFYNYLVNEEVISVNYFKEISNPKRRDSLPKYVKDNDLEVMFNSFDMNNILDQRNRLILEVLYSTGIRVGELVNIKINDINGYDNTIKILGKGSKERIVMYGSFCEDILNIYLNDGRSKLDKNNSDYLFLNRFGNRLSDRYVREVIDNVVRKCEVDYRVSPHTLRHTFATDMLNAGADLVSVKDLLGHSSLNTTSIYTHVSNEQIRKVYEFAHPRAK